MHIRTSSGVLHGTENRGSWKPVHATSMNGPDQHASVCHTLRGKSRGGESAQCEVAPR
ncbi:hypothetical protein [Salinicoccus jeotgali]|uniref:hypothetical protein n=1 Tax=Salinicoccus jeotgali TaxID=381634 RepID=UPI0031D61B84